MSKVALVTGNDTGVGKTHVAAFLAKKLSSLGPVRYLKLVETGITEPLDSDAAKIERMTASSVEKTVVLHSFRATLAPTVAAAREGIELSLNELVLEAREAQGSAWTIIEGAGGVAVPLDASGADWRDFATALPVDAVALVVENRLGAINQMRLLEAYCRELPMPCGVWLNEVDPQNPDVLSANEEASTMLRIPTWANQRHGQEPELVAFPLMDEEMR